MSLSEASGLLMTLYYLKVEVSLADGDLRTQATPGRITPSLRDDIIRLKPELVRILSVPAEAEHCRLVAEGLETFPGTALEDDETWEKFRALAQRHFGHMDVWDRITCSFRGLYEIICRMGEKQPADVVTIARLRGCGLRLERLCEGLREREERRNAAPEGRGASGGPPGPETPREGPGGENRAESADIRGVA